MEKQIAANPDISDFERLLDQNWNERKQLTEAEFDLRGEVQLLLQQGDVSENFSAARQREGEAKASLARNDQEYEALIEGWAAAAAKVVS